MIDLKRTFFSWTDSCPLALGSGVSEEGQGLISVLEGGIEKVKPSAGLGGETFAGFAVFRQKDFTTRPVVEEVTVPAAAPYEVELSGQSLIAGQIRVHDVLANTDLTVGAGAGQYTVNLTTGVVSFNAAEAGRSMMIYYRHNLTLAQAKALYYEAPTNYPDPNYFASVGVGKGKGRLFTAFYDQSIDWEAAAGVTLGADGILTSGGAGAAVPGARVVHVPTAAQPYLGIEFNA